MKRIRFTQDTIYESEGPGKGPKFDAGSVHDFEDHFADRWLRRDLAIEVAPVANTPGRARPIDGEQLAPTPMPTPINEPAAPAAPRPTPTPVPAIQRTPARGGKGKPAA